MLSLSCYAFSARQELCPHQMQPVNKPKTITLLYCRINSISNIAYDLAVNNMFPVITSKYGGTKHTITGKYIASVHFSVEDNAVWFSGLTEIIPNINNLNQHTEAFQLLLTVCCEELWHKKLQLLATKFYLFD